MSRGLKPIPYPAGTRFIDHDATEFILVSNIGGGVRLDEIRDSQNEGETRVLSWEEWESFLATRVHRMIRPPDGSDRPSAPTRNAGGPGPSRRYG